jgi:SAM-dependent methyltransferase
MLQLAAVGPRDHVIDLGSGDGRIVITAARRFGASGLGVEIVPELVQRSRANARTAGVADRVEFREQDLFRTDLARASVITMCLLPAVNLQLRPRLLALAPGTRLVNTGCAAKQQPVWRCATCPPHAASLRVKPEDKAQTTPYERSLACRAGSARWRPHQIQALHAAAAGSSDHRWVTMRAVNNPILKQESHPSFGTSPAAPSPKRSPARINTEHRQPDFEGRGFGLKPRQVRAGRRSMSVIG